MKGIETKVRLGDLEVSENNHYNLTDIQSLMCSIKKYGLIEPLTIWGPTENGKAIVLSGGRRTLALREICGEDEMIPCYLLSYSMTGEEEYNHIEESNAHNRKLRKRDIQRYRYQLMTKLKESLEKGQIDRSDIPKMFAETTGCTVRLGRSYTKIFLDGAPEIRDAVGEGMLNAMPAASLLDVVPYKKQAEVAEELCKCKRSERQRRLEEIRMEYSNPHDKKEALMRKDVKVIRREMRNILKLKRHYTGDEFNLIKQELKKDGILDELKAFLN